MKKVKFIDPIKEYKKADSIEIKINGGSKFVVIENVLSNIMSTLGYRKESVDFESDYVRYMFMPKHSRKDND